MTEEQRRVKGKIEKKKGIERIGEEKNICNEKLILDTIDGIYIDKFMQ